MKDRSVTDRLAGHERPASLTRQNAEDQPFRVVGIDGKTRGLFEGLGDALAAFNDDDLAAAISLGNYVVAGRREGGAA